ncbi:hypothetical protein ACSBR2_031207 [Camellia fascicularis]
MAKCLKETKSALEKMVMDARWKIYKGDGKNPMDATAREVKQLIVNDVWWDDLDYLLSFTEPIVDMLRDAHTNALVLHSIYDLWDTMIENVKAIIFEHEDKDHITRQPDFIDTIHEILEARWTKNNTPLYCIAHSLVPKYYHESWLQGGSNGIRRLAPHEDEEVSTNRSKCFEQLFQKNTTHLRNVYVEYGAFSSGDWHRMKIKKCLLIRASVLSNCFKKIQFNCEMFMLNMVLFQVDLAISISHMLLKQECMRSQFLGGLIMVLQHHCCKG